MTKLVIVYDNPAYQGPEEIAVPFEYHSATDLEVAIFECAQRYVKEISKVYSDMDKLTKKYLDESYDPYADSDDTTSTLIEKLMEKEGEINSMAVSYYGYKFKIKNLCSDKNISSYQVLTVDEWFEQEKEKNRD